MVKAKSHLSKMESYEELRDKFIDLQVEYGKAFNFLVHLTYMLYPDLVKVEMVDGEPVVDISSKELFELLTKVLNKDS